jgi:hypothetical protein
MPAQGDIETDRAPVSDQDFVTVWRFPGMAILESERFLPKAFLVPALHSKNSLHPFIRL